MKVLSALMLIVIFCFSNSFGQKQVQWDIKTYKKNLKYLSSDKLKGRKPGSLEDSLSASFISNYFKSIGLKAYNNSYFQKFDILSDIELTNRNNLFIDGIEAKISHDYLPVSNSKNATAEGNVIFAGYGYQSVVDSIKWNDYLNINLTNKWALILESEPAVDENGKPIRSIFETAMKVKQAVSKGAIGVIFVLSNADEKLNKLMVTKGPRANDGFSVPVIKISRDLANKLLAKSKTNLMEILEKLKQTNKTVNLDLNTVVKSTIDLKSIYLPTQNIIGYLEGTDPKLKNEYIVFGGHYDHLGMGGVGSGTRTPDKNEIHNGADDNASGTVAIMEMARQIVSHKNDMRRSIIFIAFTGEEMGLIGSKYFTSHSTVNIKNIKAMLNYDMVGRLDKQSHKMLVTGTGTANEFEKLLRKYNDTTKLKLEFSADGFGGSDHTSFYLEKIPVLFYNSGMHQQYHTPEDDFELINFQGVEDILDFSYKIALDVINRDTAVTYHEIVNMRKGGSSRSYKVTLGIMPGFTATTTDGLKVEGVTKDGPADKAGILRDDVIILFEGTVIHNVYDYMEQLNKLNKGQKIKVQIIRNKTKKEIEVQL